MLPYHYVSQSGQSNQSTPPNGYAYYPTMQFVPIEQFLNMQQHYQSMQQRLLALEHELNARAMNEAQLGQALVSLERENARLGAENRSLKKHITGVQPVRFNEEENSLEPISSLASISSPVTGFMFEKAVLELPSKNLAIPHFLQTLRPRIERGEDSHLYFQQFIPHLMEEVRASLYARLQKIQQQRLRSFTAKFKAKRGRDIVMTEVGDYFVEITCVTSALPKLNHDFSCEAIWIMVPQKQGPKKSNNQEVLNGVLAVASVLNQEDRAATEIRILMLKSDFQSHMNIWGENSESAIQMHWLYGLLPASRMFQVCLNTPSLFLEQAIVQGELEPWPLSHASETSAAVEDIQPVVSQQQVLDSLGPIRAGLYCLQGPPGTGKTTVIAHLMGRWISEFPQERILLCAPSNPATQVILRKVKTLLPHVAIAWIGVSQHITDDMADVSVKQYTKYLYVPLIALQAKIGKLSLEELKNSLLKEYERIYQALHALHHERNTFVKRHIQEKVLLLEEFVKSEMANLTEYNVLDEAVALDVLKKMIDRLKDDAHMLEYFLVQRAQIVFSTLVASGREWLKRQVEKFERVVVDEAAQAQVLQTLIPFCFNPNVGVLVGDPQQLPATVESQVAKEAGFEKSLFAVLTQDCQQPYPMLGTQYRMHPSICKWPSEQYYQGNLKTDNTVMTKYPLFYSLRAPYFFRSSRCFFDICSGREARNQNGSLFNHVEAFALVRSVVFLLNSGFKSEQIGIITFYAAQIDVIIQLLKTMIQSRKVKAEALGKLAAYTVDSFQGSEREAIFISSVRSEGESGFLDDGRRVNVAMTRAKSALFMFGNRSSLMASSSDLAHYVNSLQQDEIVSERDLNSFFTATRS